MAQAEEYGQPYDAEHINPEYELGRLIKDVGGLSYRLKKLSEYIKRNPDRLTADIWRDYENSLHGACNNADDGEAWWYHVGYDSGVSDRPELNTAISNAEGAIGAIVALRQIADGKALFGSVETLANAIARQSRASLDQLAEARKLRREHDEAIREKHKNDNMPLDKRVSMLEEELKVLKGE